jgi:hypothetical protein
MRTCGQDGREGQDGQECSAGLQACAHVGPEGPHYETPGSAVSRPEGLHYETPIKVRPEGVSYEMPITGMPS